MEPGLQVQVKVALIKVRPLCHSDLESVTSTYLCSASCGCCFNIVVC